MTLLTKTITYTIDLGLLGEVDAVVFYSFTPGQRGRYYGPPEDCYPDEPHEIELLDVTVPNLVIGEVVRNELIGILESDDNLDMAILEQESDVGGYEGDDE